MHRSEATPAVSQALVAIGGKATRLGTAISVPLSKSFITFGDRPALHWCLEALAHAGIREIVLAHDHPRQRDEAESVINELGHGFEQIVFFADRGLGAHGLPYHARDLLHDEFIFECGHSLMTPEHYRRLISAKSSKNIAASLFDQHPANPRRLLAGKTAAPGPTLSSLPLAPAHPFVLDARYVTRLPSFEYKIGDILDYYSRRKAVRYIYTRTPPEFDVVEELIFLHDVWSEGPMEPDSTTVEFRYRAELGKIRS